MRKKAHVHRAQSFYEASTYYSIILNCENLKHLEVKWKYVVHGSKSRKENNCNPWEEKKDIYQYIWMYLLERYALVK